MNDEDDQTHLDFTRKHARNSDPDTSKGAAASMREEARKQCDLIERVLREADRPLIFEEIGDRCGLHKTQVSRRLSDLGAAFRAKTTGVKRPTRAGRPAREWVAI